jgi:hypothetical protein
MTSYLDGVYYTSTAFGATRLLPYIPNINYIGRPIDANLRYFEGGLRELIVYNTPLSQNDALAVSTALRMKWGMSLRFPPPVRFAPTSNIVQFTETINVAESLYGVGSYTMRASSVNNNILASSFVYVFDLIADATNIWRSGTVYTSATGLPTASAARTVVDGATIAGEWIQIQLPQQIIPSGLSLLERTTTTAVAFMLAGSNDGITWTSIYTTTRSLVTFDGTYSTFYFTTTNAYSYYRFIVQQIKITTIQYILHELNIYGYPI